jgi:hypothetical protein
MRVDLQHREIGMLVGQDRFGLEFATVVQYHGDLLGAANNVMVGDDHPARAEDHTRAERLLDPLSRQAERRLIAEEATENRIVQKRRAGLHRAARIDVHDGRRDLFDDRRKREVDHFAAAGHRPGLSQGRRQRREDQSKSENKRTCGHCSCNLMRGSLPRQPGACSSPRSNSAREHLGQAAGGDERHRNQPALSRPTSSFPATLLPRRVRTPRRKRL